MKEPHRQGQQMVPSAVIPERPTSPPPSPPPASGARACTCFCHNCCVPLDASCPFCEEDHADASGHTCTEEKP